MSIAHIVEESPPRKLYRWRNQTGTGFSLRPRPPATERPISHSEEAYAAAYGLLGEPAWKRALRRFPIDSHKPGP
jgi:hypothetical protein